MCKQIFLFVCLSLTLLSCNQNKIHQFGELVSLTGMVESRRYTVATPVDSLTAFIFTSDDEITYKWSEENNRQARKTTEFHIDMDHEKIAAFDNHSVEIVGILRPSENSHHLGSVCLEIVEIEIPFKP